MNVVTIHTGKCRPGPGRRRPLRLYSFRPLRAIDPATATTLRVSVPAGATLVSDRAGATWLDGGGAPISTWVSASMVAKWAIEGRHGLAILSSEPGASEGGAS